MSNIETTQTESGVNRLRDSKVLSRLSSGGTKMYGSPRRTESTLCSMKKYCSLFNLMENKFGTLQSFKIKQIHKWN
jgi:hypothetical protein